MDYKTGSYLIKGQKDHQCELCKLPIRQGGFYFQRVMEYGVTKINSKGESYKLKNYYRYHIVCACGLNDLSQNEINIINKI